MRKFTMFVLLATSAIPAMAAAQEEGGRHGRQQQSEQSDNRPAREARAERPERAQQNEQRQQMQAERQAQMQQMQAARQAQVQQIQQQQVPQQVERQQVQVQRDGERGQRFDGRGSREQDGQPSRDERMQQLREQTEQRRAQLGGPPQDQSGGLVARQGHYRTVPDINPNAGQPAPENRDARFAHRDRHDSSQWTNNWRNDNRYDWRRYRDHHHSIFRIGFYFDPFGYSYNRFGIGSYMYPGYYQSSFWINDPWQYRLPPAYGPYRWVRYHSDALLIDTWSGEVVDVIYGFFW